MAKVNENAKVEMTIKVTGTAAQLKGLAKYAKDNKLEVEKLADKVTDKGTKKSQTKKTSKAKSDSEFDREKYESIATELGVLGKHGVHKFARQVVYKAMEDSDYESNVDEYKAEINKLATDKNLTWFLGENVEVEDDDDDEVAFN